MVNAKDPFPYSHQMVNAKDPFPYSQGVSSTDIQSYVPVVEQAIGALLDSLIQRRAETISVAGIYPIGCSATYLTVFQQDLGPKTGCVEWVNDLARRHNLQLQLELNRLRRTHRHSKISYADYYGPMMHLYKHPGTFGVREKLAACCGGEGPYNFSLSISCGSPGSSLCSDPSSYAG
ncbi:hypothetical protein ZIOFF_003489 [Zingiber officinale]|uniref:GDSL esterase/lipase n=1 Tax=Zingiber officinale TaxID=94328 RepID=A0A8J5ITI6_ZINOF|nr:hypothetical protein ZIOFF_003489 [Zingiber officinale]